MLGFLLSICEEKDTDKVQYLYDHFHTDIVKLTKSELHKARDKNYEIDFEDVVQNIFLKLTIYIDKVNFEWTEKEMRSYIMKMVDHAVIDYVNGSRRSVKAEELCYEEIDEMSINEFLSMLNIKDRYDEVVEAINKLDPIYNLTLTYCYLDEMDIDDIAQLMCVTKKAVYTRLERGKQQLLDLIGRERVYCHDRQGVVCASFERCACEKV